jgi:hypothetical protein
VRPHSGVAIARQFIAARATERDGFIGPKLERLSFAELHHDILISLLNNYKLAKPMTWWIGSSGAMRGITHA